MGYGFYVTFSNASQSPPLYSTGLNYNLNSYNYTSNHLFTPNKFTFNYTDIYTFENFINNDSYIPLLYITGKNLNSNRFTNGNFNFVIEPVVSY